MSPSASVPPSGSAHAPAQALPPCIGPSHWGHAIVPRGYEALVAVPAHVALDLRAVPEGALCVARCTRCAGRCEALLDWRPLRGLPEHVVDQRIAAGATHTLTPLQTTWLPAHRDCLTRPLTHALPPEVQRLVDDALAAARVYLAAGEPVPAVLQLRLADGGVSRLPLDRIPPSDPRDGGAARSMALHLLGTAVRDGLRLARVPATAAVMVAEGWYVAPGDHAHADPAGEHAGSPADDGGRDAAYPAFSPHRREGLVIAVVTPDVGMMGMADIVRDGGVLDEGPGRAGPVTLHPMPHRSRVLDGLLAAAQPVATGAQP